MTGKFSFCRPAWPKALWLTPEAGQQAGGSISAAATGKASIKKARHPNTFQIVLVDRSASFFVGRKFFKREKIFAGPDPGAARSGSGSRLLDVSGLHAADAALEPRDGDGQAGQEREQRDDVRRDVAGGGRHR